MFKTQNVSIIFVSGLSFDLQILGDSQGEL